MLREGKRETETDRQTNRRTEILVVEQLLTPGITSFDKIELVVHALSHQSVFLFKRLSCI